MRRFLPYTTAGLIIAVVIIGLLISQLAAIAVQYDSRREAFAVLEAVRIGDRIITVARSIAAIPPPQRPELSRALNRRVLAVGWGSDSIVASDHPRDLKSRLMEDVLRQRTDESEVLEIRVIHMADTAQAGNNGGSDSYQSPYVTDHPDSLVETILRDQPVQAFYVVALQLADGSWLNVAAPYTETVPMWPVSTLALLGAIVLVVIAVLAWSIQRLISPLQTLMQAAERLGVDVNAPPVPESGPRDGRLAIRAFNAMQERIRSFVQDRMRTVAAISHDLRTPITRLRLRAEFIEDPTEQSKMLADLEQMETMIQSALCFFREDARTEPRQVCDLAGIIRSACEDRPSVQIRFATREPLPRYCGQPVALKRALTNLIDNAVKYGGSARVTVGARDDIVVIDVEDSGPGIPESRLEEVFQPFFRLDHSRSRDAGGTGLGLSIARTVCRAHGGDVVLCNRREGGLRATVTLPMRHP